MSSSDAAPPVVPEPGTSLRGNLVIGAASIALGAGVIPYGASMPYIREGIPGPGLFPMMIGGFLVLFGGLLILTGVRAARRAAGDGAGHAPVPADVVPAGGDGTAGATGAAGAAIVDTDIGTDGPRRWINGAVLMGGIIFFVLAAEPLGFPLTMAVVVFAIVFSLKARWWVAAITAVLTSVGLWAMFELGLMVQLPDGIIQGF